MRDSVDVNGSTRTYTVVGPVPARDLVLVFHGSKQTGEKHRRFTGRAFDTLAGDGTAVVYLDGHKGNWNDARRGSAFPARTENADDVAFTRAVVAKLAQPGGRVFAVGYSNGGQMVMRLAHEMPVAGAVVIAATMPAPDDFLLAGVSPAPVPVLLIHGTRDPIVSYAGGEMRWWARKMFKVSGRTLSAPETAAYFARHNGIAGPPVSRAVSAAVELTEHREPGREPVALYTIRGGGHTIPGPHKAPAVLGRTNRDVHTADLIREFFGLERPGAKGDDISPPGARSA